VKKINYFFAMLLWVWAGSALAQEEQGSKSLKDRIRSVSNRLYIKGGRMEITLFPLTSISLNDGFYQKFGGGLGFAYHLNDAFAIQVMGTYSLNAETENATYHGTGAVKIPYAGKRTFLASADLAWSPLYGKISLASESIFHFDTYVMAGMGVIGGEIISGSNAGVCFDFGLGVRMFLTRMVAIKAELMDFMVFNDKVSIVQGNEKSDVQSQLLFNLGLSFFFPEGAAEE
jgi:outer membrane beta-barrel protein